MKLIINYLILPSLIGALLFATNVNACARVEDNSLCAQAGQSKAVFVGKIVATRERESNSYESELAPNTLPFAFPIREIDFEVQEEFFGVKKASQITIYSTAKKCDYQFMPGKTYLVYAIERIRGKFNTTSCAATRPLPEASVELSFLRDSIRRSSGALILGTILENTSIAINQTFSKNKPQTAAITVLLKPISEKGRIRQTKTDSEGNYEIDGVPAGRYILELVLPGKIRMVDGTIIGVETSGLGCITRNIIVENKK